MDLGGWRKACSELDLEEGLPLLVRLDDEEVYAVRRRHGQGDIRAIPERPERLPG
jgi:hypothetical protein